MCPVSSRLADSVVHIVHQLGSVPAVNTSVSFVAWMSKVASTFDFVTSVYWAWTRLSLRPKTETKRLNFGLSPVLSLTNQRCASSLTSSATHRWFAVYLCLPPTKEEVNVFAHVRLSVCLSFSKITQKRVHGFGWNVACRQMSGHGRTD